MYPWGSRTETRPPPRPEPLKPVGFYHCPVCEVGWTSTEPVCWHCGKPVTL